jgi:hypothetical protein
MVELGMSYEIKESDWKLFRRFHPIALERFCQQVIEEVNRATSNCTGDYHQRYLEIFDLLLERNEKLGGSRRYSPVKSYNSSDQHQRK